tara:strand:+ start:1349 stop:1588 length:240 start_codon:yes stop_codon:yes gene_type:complete
MYIPDDFIEEECTNCDGFGIDPKDEEEEKECNKCDGVGFFLFYIRTHLTSFNSEERTFHQIKIEKGIEESFSKKYQDLI